MSNITAPRQVRFYPPTSLLNFDILTEPTVEGVTAESYMGDDIADGGQALNLMDNKVRRFVKAFDNLLANPQFKTDSDYSKGSGWSIKPGKPGLAVFLDGSSGGDLTQAGVVTSSQDYVVIVKCSEHTTGTFTPKLGTASDGSINSVGITVHEITANGTGFNFDAPSIGGASFEYMYILDANDYRFDLVLNSAKEIDFAIIDGHNLLEVFPASLFREFNLYHHISDSFGAATKITEPSIFSGLLGKEQPVLRYNGDTSNVSVASDDALNLGDDGLMTIFFQGNLKDIGDHAQIICEREEVDADTHYQFGLDTSGNVVVRALLNAGSEERKRTSGAVATNGKGSLAITIDMSKATGLIAEAFFKGASIGNCDTADASTSIPTTTALTIGKNAAGTAETLLGDGARLLIFNRILSEAEILFLENGGEIPQADQWGDKKLLTGNDYNMLGANNWANVDLGTFDINTTVPGKMYMLGDGGADRCTIPNVGIVAGDIVRITILSRLNAGASTAIRCGTQLNTNFMSFTPAGSEARFTGTFISTGTDLFLGLNTSLAGIAFEHDNIQVDILGATGAWEPVGVSKGQGLLLDSSKNRLNGTSNNVEYINAPDADNLGYYLMRFTSVTQALYWYLSINEDNDLPIALQKYGQWILGKSYLFNLTTSQQYGGALAFPGVDLTETESGTFDATKRYEAKDRFTVPLSFQDRAGWNQLQEFLAILNGRQYPFYMEVLPLDDDDESVFYKVRARSNNTPYRFLFASERPWRAGLDLEVDL